MRRHFLTSSSHTLEMLISRSGEDFVGRSLHILLDFPGSSAGKESACNAGDQGLISGLGRAPGRGQGNPLQYSCLEIPHGQRSLTGYSPWGCKELNTAEQLNTAHTIIGLDSINSRKKPLDCLFYESVVVQKRILSCCFFLYLALHY